MLALQITSTKNFMNRLLAGDAFDDFLLEEAMIRTAVDVTIDGHINTDFYPPEERDAQHLPYPLERWSDRRGLCFDLIKGRHTPLFFRFVLQLKPEKAAALLGEATDPAQVRALVLNIRYDGTKAILTTGVSYQTFVLQKEADHIWDQALCRHLDVQGIGYERL